MGNFGERKKQFFELDARWNIRIGIRMLMNIICIMSIVMAVMTIQKGKTTEFRPKAFTKANTVLVYIPCDGITIVWNMFNIMLFLVKKKNVPHWLNTLAHFMLGFGFAVVGVYVTVVAWSGYKGMNGNLYDVSKGPSTITAVNGTQITVDSSNANSCPAFANCQEQSYWTSGAKGRSLISVIGCTLFDAVFLLHVAFFFWCMNDSVFGLRGRTQRQSDKDERARIKALEMENPVPSTSDSEKPFDLSSKPSISIDEKYNSEFSYERSTVTDIEMTPRRHTTMPQAASRSTMTFESKTPRYPSLPPTLVLRPSDGSRDSLSLSIFETTHSVPPPPARSSLTSTKRMSRSFTAPLAGQGVPRASSPDPDSISTLSYERQMQQQQLQQLQQQVPHKHQPGCTCGQARTSYSSVSTHQPRANRQSSDTTQHRTSLHNNAASSTRPAANRTSSVFSGVSSHSAASSNSSNWAPSYPMPPVPPIPQSFTTRTQTQPTARSSLRHSISPAEILDKPSQSHVGITSPQTMSAVRKSLHNQYQGQSSRQSLHSLRSLQNQPHYSSKRQSSYQLEPLNFFDSLMPIPQASDAMSSSSGESVKSISNQVIASISNSNDSKHASLASTRKSSSVQMHQALPDVLSPDEKDLTALPMPPPAAAAAAAANTSRGIRASNSHLSNSGRSSPATGRNSPSSGAGRQSPVNGAGTNAPKRNTLRKSGLRFEMQDPASRKVL